ncbi:MAG TPA: hypothetical protein DD737_05290, partial [Ruminococcaceae bacterium]|nr:hypothetical protein [Oscillospiraceae bacterium]
LHIIGQGVIESAGFPVLLEQGVQVLIFFRQGLTSRFVVFAERSRFIDAGSKIAGKSGIRLCPAEMQAGEKYVWAGLI